MRRIAPVFFTVFLMVVSISAQALQQTPIFVSGENGYHTYRIPSVIVAPDGSVLAFCEGRKGGRSDAGNIDLVMKRSTDGGKTWGGQTIVWDDEDNTCGNPCPVVDEDTGIIWLLMTHNLGQDHEGAIVSGSAKGTRTVWVCHSKDNGQSWSEPREITPTAKKDNWSWYATGPGVGIQLRHEPYQGRLVIPCDHKTKGDEIGYFSHVIYSDDHGQSWQIGGVTQNGVNECQVIERMDGSLLLNMRRSRHNDVIHRAIATSQNGGESWSDLRYDEELIAPRCQASLIRYKPIDQADLPLVLFSNPANTNQRIQMTVRLSENDGKTWPHSKQLHTGPSAYSCLTVLPDGSIACLYERGQENPYETITFSKFSLDWIRGE